MDLNGIGSRGGVGAAAFPNDSEKAENPRLREACQQFEGLLLGLMLKESLKETISDSAGDAASGFDQFQDFCVEQVATSLAESSSMGISDQMYEQLSRQGGSR